MGLKQQAEIDRLKAELAALHQSMTPVQYEGWKLDLLTRWTTTAPWGGKITCWPLDQESDHYWPNLPSLHYEVEYECRWWGSGRHDCASPVELLKYLIKENGRVNKDHGDPEKVERERLEHITKRRREERASKFFPYSIAVLRSIAKKKSNLDVCWEGIQSHIRDHDLTEKKDAEYVESERVAHIQRESERALWENLNADDDRGDIW